MKKHLPLLLSLLTAITLLLAGCKSKKEVTPPVEPVKWQNVTMPVSVSIDQPMSLTLNGTLTMVRGDYALVTFRTFGIEVASAYISPSQMDMVLKMPSKMWVSEPVGERLSSRGINFAELQDAFVSETIPQLKMSGFSVSANGSRRTISVSTTAKGMKLSASLNYNLDDAKWNVETPATFSTPGSGYRKLDLQSAAKSLGK